jgi:hypothetical protein
MFQGFAKKRSDLTMGGDPANVYISQYHKNRVKDWEY